MNEFHSFSHKQSDGASEYKELRVVPDKGAFAVSRFTTEAGVSVYHAAVSIGSEAYGAQVSIKGYHTILVAAVVENFDGSLENYQAIKSLIAEFAVSEITPKRILRKSL